MRRSVYSIFLGVLFCSSLLIISCSPSCKLIPVNDIIRDTLTGYGERFVWPIPVGANWRVDTALHNGGPSAVLLGDTDDDVGFNQIHSYVRSRRTYARNQIYENNKHDYRHDKRFQTDPLTGKVTPITFVAHVCSSIGGWYGVFEMEGDTLSNGMCKIYFSSEQEAPDKIFGMTINCRYRTTAQKDSLRQEALRHIAATEWLSAFDPYLFEGK